jgi:hypothetical protein
MRPLLAALLLVLAAFVSTPAAAQLEGSYELTQVNGQALPTASPTETTFTLRSMTLVLKADGQYEMEITGFHTASSTPLAVDLTGAYRVEGDGLALHPDQTTHAQPADFRWAVDDGGTLTLTDDQDHRFTFTRPGSGEAWSPGTWNAVAINGHALPAPWPLQPQVTITQLSFAFTGDGQATVRMAGTRGGEALDEQATAPRYTVTGDRLTILDEDGSVDEEFAWTLRDGTLRLVDEHGHVYVFEPAAATAP